MQSSYRYAYSRSSAQLVDYDCDYDTESETDPELSRRWASRGEHGQSGRAFRPDRGGVSRLKPLLQGSRGTAHLQCAVLSTLNTLSAFAVGGPTEP